MRLAKRDPAIDQLRRPRHDEQAFAVHGGGGNAFGGDRIGRRGRLRYNIHGFNPEMLLSPAPTQHFNDASTGKTPVNWLSLPHRRSAADSRFPAGTANEISRSRF